jgi:hypothetical protein
LLQIFTSAEDFFVPFLFWNRGKRWEDEWNLYARVTLSNLRVSFSFYRQYATNWISHVATDWLREINVLRNMLPREFNREFEFNSPIHLTLLLFIAQLLMFRQFESFGFFPSHRVNFYGRWIYDDSWRLRYNRVPSLKVRARWRSRPEPSQEST